MLGGLCRWLRLLGCDVVYDPAGEDSALLAIALGEDRILLTRDNRLAGRAKDAGYLVGVDGTKAQLGEVIRRFNIEPKLYGNHCPECNGPVEIVPRESVKGAVPRG